LDVVAWQRFPSSAGLPKDVVDKWGSSIQHAVKDPRFLVQAEKVKKTVAYLGPLPQRGEENFGFIFQPIG
jgi:hypothetical protein